MRKLFIVSFFFLLGAEVYGQRKAEQDFKKLEWLAGSWTRTNNKPDQTGKESWTLVSPYKLVGKGYTLKGTDTVFVEKLSIILKEETIFYVVEGAGNARPTYFKFSSITKDSFVCENPKHDFPQRIAYKLENGIVKATVSGQGKHIDFVFAKK